MTWFYATSVSVTNGATVVSVNSGDDIALIQPSDALVIGTQPPVEIKRTYLDGSSNKKIELLKPWPYGSQTNQSAEAYPTAGDFQSATAVLKQLIDGFTLATQAEAQAGTENTKPMTALRVKQAMDSLLGSASKLVASAGVGDTTLGRAARIGDHGLGLSGNDMMRVTAVTDYSGGVDFNSLTKPGWYKVLVNSNSSSNGPVIPVTGSGYWYVQVLEYAGGQSIKQRAHAYLTHGANGVNPGKPYTFERDYYNGSWSNKWQAIGYPMVGNVYYDAATGENVGAVIERGSNSNGDYVKFADGTLICTGSRVGALSTNQYAGVTNLRAAEYTWFFPAPFLAGTVPSIAGHGGDQSYAGWLGAAGLTATQCNVVYFTATVSPTAFLYPIAIGRWR